MKSAASTILLSFNLFLKEIIKSPNGAMLDLKLPELQLLQVDLLPLLLLEHGYQLLLSWPMRLLTQLTHSIQLDHGLFQPWKTGLHFKNPVSLIQAEHSPSNTDMSHIFKTSNTTQTTSNSTLSFLMNLQLDLFFFTPRNNMLNALLTSTALY